MNVDRITFNNASDDFCPDKFSVHLVRQTVIWSEIVRCPTVISGPDLGILGPRLHGTGRVRNRAEIIALFRLCIHGA